MNKIRKKGFTLIEILLAISITAMMMVAVAAAFNAAFASYQVNNEMTAVSNASRNALTQFCAIVRSAYNDPDIATIDVDTDGMGITITDANGSVVDYAYNQSNDTLETRIDDGNWYVLISNVSPVTNQPIFSVEPPLDTTWPLGTAGVVSIKFTISQGSTTQTISAAAVPRNIIFK